MNSSSSSPTATIQRWVNVADACPVANDNVSLSHGRSCTTRGFLILDEATSSVDVETEKKIQQAIDRLVQNRTTFAIAHRLSTLRNADRLFVIEKGKGVECGSHEELMEQKGIYYKLVETQREAANVRAAAQAVER